MKSITFIVLLYTFLKNILSFDITNNNINFSFIMILSCFQNDK